MIMKMMMMMIRRRNRKKMTTLTKIENDATQPREVYDSSQVLGTGALELTLY